MERQQQDTDALAEREGLTVTHRIVDNDRSASRRARREREGFIRMLDLARAGEIDAVVVYDLDRFTRNPDELGAWIDATTARPKFRIYTTGSVVDLKDDNAVFGARVLLAAAEKEASGISRRVKREAVAAAELGTPRWSARPFGFQRDGTHVESEVAELRAMYADVLAGKSQGQIARDLNDRGVANASGARWQSATIGFLIRAPRNAGLRAYNGKVIGKAQWAPIVPEQTWRDAVAALDARRVGTRKAPRSLLGGLVICAGCGGRMSRSARAYRCLPRSDGYKTTCGITIAGDRLDAYVTGLALAAFGDTTAATNDTTPGDGQRAAAEVVRIREQIEELAAMLGRGELEMNAFKAAKHPLDVRLAKAQTELADTDARVALERIAGPTATLADRWDDLDVALRSRIIGTIVESITVRKADRQGQPFTPDRVTVAMRE